MPLIGIALGLLLSLSACSAGPAPSVDTGVYRASVARVGVYDTGAEFSGEELWSFETGSAVRSTPAIADDVVYVGSDDGSLYALDAKTGSEKWRFETEGAVSSSPHVTGGVVYFTSEDGHVYAVDAAKGSMKWKVQTAEPKSFGLRDWNYFSPSPLVDGTTVYVGSRGDDAQFYALDAIDGSVKWSITTGRLGVRSAPTLVDGTLYVTSSDGKALALDPEDGSEKWSHDVHADIRSIPVVAGNTVFFGSRSAHTWALSSDTGELRWKREEGEGSWVESSPAVAQGTVYVGGSDSHQFSAVNAEDGETKWTVEVETNIFSSPAVSGDTVLVATGDAYQADRAGHLYALDRATGKRKWSFEAKAFFSSPVPSGLAIYIGNDDGKVYAIK